MITLRGLQRLKAADLIYDDRRAGPAPLSYARPDMARAFVGKVPSHHAVSQAAAISQDLLVAGWPPDSPGAGDIESPDWAATGADLRSGSTRGAMPAASGPESSDLVDPLAAAARASRPWPDYL